MAGPATGCAGRAGGTKSNCRATAGVTPTVAAVGTTGARNCACAADWPGANPCATAAIGPDPAIAAAGTTVMAPRLTKLLTVERLLTVTLVIAVCTFCTLVAFSRRT